MNPAKVLFTGGSGLLGGEIRLRLPRAQYPTSAVFDVTDYQKMSGYLDDNPIEMIIHAAAFTSPPRCDKEPLAALQTNVVGTANVVRLCLERGIRLVYISTDYDYTEDDPVLPVNTYAWTKLGGECAVRLLKDALIIRTSFGPNHFPYPKAFIDQWTSRVSVREVADKIVTLLATDATGVVHVGGPRRTVYEYAKSLDPQNEVGALSVDAVSFRVPRDTSLNSSRYDRLIA
jgi:dTDP-4-dehydrorhamnose reductase